MSLLNEDVLVPPERKLVSVLDGKRVFPPPVWMMRQAGRYLPEYRVVRGQFASFLDLCHSPQWAAEITLQPVRRFHFDTAILFSDILVVPDALGQAVHFAPGEGPRLDPITTGAAIAKLEPDALERRLERIYETVALVRDLLDPETTLIGFCGAPWTVATYMVAGSGSADQRVTRIWAYREPDAFRALIDILVEASVLHLTRQLEAGADAVQIFDTWAGVLGDREFERWVSSPTRRIVEGVRARVPHARIIGFPRGAGLRAESYVSESGVDAIGLDWMMPLDFARERLQPRLPVQGNLDPLALLAGGAALDESVDAILESLGDGPLIFNLGHGILPETPVEHVSRMLERVRGAN